MISWAFILNCAFTNKEKLTILRFVAEMDDELKDSFWFGSGGGFEHIFFQLKNNRWVAFHNQGDIPYMTISYNAYEDSDDLMDAWAGETEVEGHPDSFEMGLYLLGSSIKDESTVEKMVAACKDIEGTEWADAYVRTFTVANETITEGNIHQKIAEWMEGQYLAPVSLDEIPDSVLTKEQKKIKYEFLQIIETKGW